MKNLSTTIIAFLMCTACGTTSRQSPSLIAAAKLEEVRDVSPGLERYTRESLDGDLWKRPGLTPRDRSIVTMATLIAKNQTVMLPHHLDLALQNGVTPSEISELITHLAFYAGWANAIAASGLAKRTFEARGVRVSQLPSASGDWLPLDEAAEKKRADLVNESFGSVAPGVVRYTTELLFRDLWLRPGLKPRDRSLITVSALVANGQVAQIPFHLNRAMDSGLTQAEVSEALTQMAFYAGWPNVFSALPIVKDVLSKRSSSDAKHLELSQMESRPSTKGSAENFTGQVLVTPLFSATDHTRASGGSVAFEARARSHWHSHPIGQTLIVTAGVGWVQEWGGTKQVIKPGDVIQTPPGVKHWHGATATEGMTHIAIQEHVNGRVVDWMEPVSEAEYVR